MFGHIRSALNYLNVRSYEERIIRSNVFGNIEERIQVLKGLVIWEHQKVPKYLVIRGAPKKSSNVWSYKEHIKVLEC